jgi:hypothetical protein
MYNRKNIAFLLAAMLLVHAVQGQLSSYPRNFRGGNRAILVEDRDTPVAAPVVAKAQVAGVQAAGGAKGAKKVVKQQRKEYAKGEDYGDDNYGDDGYGDDYKNPEDCKDKKKKTICSKPEKPSYYYNNVYELKYKTLACTEVTVDTIKKECAEVDIIKNKEACINRIETKPVKVNKINKQTKKIRVLKPIQKKIQIIKQVNRPVQTLVTECVTVYEVREKTVCYDELKCYDTNERKLKEEKVNVKYVCPQETKIRVKKPIQKKIRVIRSACAKYSADIVGKPCTKKEDKKEYGDDYDNNYENDYKMGGNQYAAKPVKKAAAKVVKKVPTAAKVVKKQ